MAFMEITTQLFLASSLAGVKTCSSVGITVHLKHLWILQSLIKTKKS